MKPCCNKASLFFGLGSCFGMSVVATFQVRLHRFSCVNFKTETKYYFFFFFFNLLLFWLQETAVRIFHDTGALLFFASGVIYMITQCWISYKAHPYDCATSVSVVRVGLTVVAAVAIFPSILKKKKKSNIWFVGVRACLHIMLFVCEK